MSEARHQRFEIDIDEIERQLRRSVEAAPSPKPDPLAELARIVGQDDPFRGILGGAKPTPVRPASSEVEQAPAADPDTGYPDPDGYDPVVETYGSPEAAFAADDLQPLQRRRSRGRLFAVAASLLVAVGATAGVLVWRSGGGPFSLAGLPPLITADRTPLKVAPENPGGLEVPNQGRQVYERGATEGQSRVVDSREQPVDVREVVRSLPPPPTLVPPTDTASRSAPMAPTPPVAGRSSAISALGEPRRVRTVAVRPDGSTFTPGTATARPTLPELGPGMAPGPSFPPAVPVTTMSIPAVAAPGGPSASVPTAVEAPAPVPSSAVATAPPGGPPPVSVLPPQRPRFDINRGTNAAPTTAPAQRLASADPVPESTTAVTASTKPVAPVRRTFAVQIAVRSSEEEARSAYTELSGRFSADLGGKPTTFAKAEVAGRTVYRVRVGPLPKDAADTLCTRLKASGGTCFVAAI